MGTISLFLKSIIKQRRLILSMAKREVKSQYVGSTLGLVWTFIHPLVLIFVFWVVFSVGFKAVPASNVPFVVWLTAGMTCWFAFSDMISGSTNIVVGNSNLIKKTVFPAQILPVVKITSSLVAHSIFVLILMGLILLQRLPFSIFYFQSLYYLFCMLVLVLGLSWLFSSLNVFVRDINQAVALALQVGFWGTPIFWDINIMPQKIQSVLKLNPMFYIVQGYRDSFLNFIPFWDHPILTLYFWVVALSIFILGAVVFRRLQPQFSDVL
ncbi:ABC-type polysaccharide/polyol phosphate export system, permease component [Desulfocapsa sulfexigens DSM 10523]|uniref:Transport permease protein n=1 Tax=Desulfocapsa sulfexigens (strain DSM 10523 / SB164P1) TaxID=1167006 RepID=M1NH56_DESSD|nr:ABC transporter permease [Desulfocapsa sulfexigens]AGF78944.1 ABC-type polysaccharide/polyol phosphate export system, permease component [Desulfocapsa sulfexigens DSM 10523]